MRVLIFIFSLFLIVPLLSAQEKVRGNYEALRGQPEMHSQDVVVFEEFLNFGCPHCNNFRNLTLDLRKKYEGKVEFIDIPILFQSNPSDAPLRLYYVAKSLGRGEEVKHAIFDAQFKYGVSVFDPGIVNYLARTLGLGTEYTRDAQSPAINQLIEEGKLKSRVYGVRATPTIVLAQSLKMNMGSSMEDFVKNLPNTIDDLLKQ